MLPSNLLEGQTAFITGGGSGLGRVMAEHFLACGARVVIAGRRERVILDVAKELDPGLERVLGLACDVRDPGQVEAAEEAARQRFGDLHILVNNAAANFISPTERLTPNAFRIITETVLLGSVNCTLTFGKRWIAEGRPGIVLNIVAAYSQTGSPFVVPSACAKAGVEALTKSLAAEWGKYGIRLLAIAPGPFPTSGAMERLVPDANWHERLRRRIPLGRYGMPDELGHLATFLVSPLAAYITGETVRIDGGEGPALAGEFSFLGEVTPEEWKEYRYRTRRVQAMARGDEAEDSGTAGR